MLERKIMSQLEHWKENHGQSCLLVDGPRQCGKTYIIREFAKRHYDSLVEISFVREEELMSAFDGNLSVTEMIKRISLLKPEAKFIPGRTLVFLDEIQLCPNARASVKFWAQDQRFDVIESGSLLGISYKKVPSFPVGYETSLHMQSLDLEEYLWAMGYTRDSVSALREYFDKREKVPQAIHDSMMRTLREYMAVGGMPAVVNEFIRTSSFSEAQRVQDDIIGGYLADIAKYAPAAGKAKARDCFLSIPRQLAKENTKFQYKTVEHGGSARKFGSSLDWLRDAGIAAYCYNVSAPQFPLNAYVKEEQYRLYLTDIGLLLAMYGFPMKAQIVNDTLTGPAKGGIYENLAADLMIRNGHPLYYYQNEKNSVEIEFLLTNDSGAVIPVEVKANRGQTASLNKVLENQEIPYAYKFTAGNVGVSDRKITLPAYMGMFL